MSLSTFFKKLFSPFVWINIAGMIVFIILVGVIVVWGMRIYTRHGQSITVPDVTLKTMGDARKALKKMDLRVEVSDTGYVKELPMDCVLEQKPAAGEKVKPGHIISIIVNASSTPTIALPDIIQNCSLREAMARLKSMGFKVGDPQYVRGEREWVYGILVDGRQRKTGDRIPINKVVVVQAGNGFMAEEDSVVYVEYEAIYDDEEEEEIIETDEFVDGQDDFMEILE